ncbi:SDR family NAD(P)-dependent oxidoreductase [Planotetraspora sp. GP83]|uniref:SDR family NAD(P)-dependent oxidoreductase n=1 Tax=Planotetraspora sp. GP83 TaxID=3156264 RepID=UPI003516C352
MRLEGARVLITGGSSGIGAATARAMAGKRACLVLSGRDERRLQAIASETGGRAVPADVITDAAGLAERAGPVDVLVSNAGEGWAGPLTAMPDDAIERVIAVNLTAPITLAKLLLPAMIERGRGHVVFVASIAGAVGVPGEAVYSAAKAGLLVFAESLRQEAAGMCAGIGVSVVLPGVVDTPFFARRGAPYARRWPAPIPPERVARAITRTVERDQAEAFVPGWLRLPARLRGAAPGPFRVLAALSGRASRGATP